MPASARPQRRLLALCAGTAVLALAASACGFEDRAAVGVVEYEPKAEAPAAEEGHEAGQDEQAGHEEEPAEGGHEEEPAEAEEGGHGAEAETTTLTNPAQNKCHTLKGGAGRVHNGTLNDMRVYVGTDCTGESKHLGSKLSDVIAPEAEAWNSFKFVS